MATDSKQKMLNVDEIITTAAQETKVGRPADDVFNMLKVELSMPNIWKCREGNTLFIVHKSPHAGYGYFRALNADTAKNYVENSKLFIDAAYKVGFDVLVTQFQDPTILSVFKILSRNPIREGMGFATQKTNSDGYQVTLQLGTPRGAKS